MSQCVSKWWNTKECILHVTSKGIYSHIEFPCSIICVQLSLNKWYIVLSKSRIFWVFSTLIRLLRCLEIILLCGSDHSMVNVSSSSVYCHWTSVQWDWCRSSIDDEAAIMDQYTLWFILWIWCKQFRTIISRIPHFLKYVWCHRQIHKLTASNTDCIEIDTLAYNIATVVTVPE